MPAKSFSEILEKTKKQTKWWSYAAWSLPFVALALLGVSEFLVSDDWFRNILVAVGVAFFSVSVFWWWWALHKIVEIINGFDKTYQSLDEVKQEIIKTRQVIEDSTSWESSDSNR